MASRSDVSDLPLDEAVYRPPRPRRPLPGLVASLAAGLCMGLVADDVSSLAAPLALMGAAVCTVAGLLVRRTVPGSVLVHAAVVLAGLSCMQVATGTLPHDDLRRQLKRPRQFIELTGVIKSMPRVEDQDARGRPVWLFDVQADAFGKAGGAEPVTGCLRVRMVDAGSGPPAYGERWHWRGPFRMDDRPVSRRQGVAGSMIVLEGFATRLESGHGHPFIAWCYEQRARASEVLGRGLDPGTPSVGFTRALLLGMRGEVSQRVHDAFARTGTLHILALSGMHVGIVVFLLVVVLKASGITRPNWVLFFLPFLLVYTLATGAAASTVRAAVMTVVYFLAYLIRRRADPPTALALAALLILLVDPLQLFDYGFILSFLAVGGLMLLVRPVSMLLRGTVPEGDTWMAVESPVWERGLRGVWVKMVDLFGVSLSAWLVSLPVIAGVFHLVSPSALLVNIPLIPLAFVILLTGCLSLVTGAVIPSMAVVFNHANDVFCEGLMRLVDMVSRWPGSHFYVQPWPWYMVMVWFVLIIGWVLTRGRWRVLAGVALAVLIAGSVWQRHFSARAEVLLIPSGDASLMLVDGPGDHAMLVDAGAGYRSRGLIELLRGRGIDRLDRIWLTRATADAYGGLDDLLEAIRVDEVFVPEAPPALHHYHARREGWVNRLGGERVKPWPEEREFSVGKDVIVRVLFPGPGEKYRNARQSAQILHIAQGHRSLLFVSRADEELERRAVGMLQDYRADVLAVGLVDTVRCLSSEWLDLVAPQTVIFTPRAFDRLRESAEPLLRALADHGGFDLQVMENGEPVELGL